MKEHSMTALKASLSDHFVQQLQRDISRALDSLEFPRQKSAAGQQSNQLRQLARIKSLERQAALLIGGEVKASLTPELRERLKRAILFNQSAQKLLNTLQGNPCEHGTTFGHLAVQHAEYRKVAIDSVKTLSALQEPIITRPTPHGDTVSILPLIFFLAFLMDAAIKRMKDGE